ncbi:hypothetical protein EVJ32_04680 [Exiguobacterium sp. SH5S4]|uniref:hypothetical protein n=1 Tax=Exiguobacterium sp. SH5S4 TaxID=2510961 RepID=UPI001040A395|nr:hypothetical protein [Exiguobacterium sp. SH5S4]TCI26673.1 hypothetical protein EVJ32_04680 [Exiguobacterium sp. SH5S4]
MNNVTLLNKVKELDFKTLTSREESIRVMTQIAIIRKAFGVRDYESDAPAENYEREIVLTDDQIKEEFNGYMQFKETFEKYGDIGNAKYYESRLHYFIEAVEFFKPELASELKETLAKRKDM